MLKKLSKYVSSIILIVLIIFGLKDKLDPLYKGMITIYKEGLDSFLVDSNVILFVFIIGGIVLFIIGLLIRNHIFEQRKKKIDETIGYQNLLQKLGWDQIHYPVIGFGGIFAEPVNIDSKQHYLDEYLFGFGAKYIVDFDGKKFMLKKTRMCDLGYDVGMLNKTKLEKLEATGEIISFEKLKQDMISDIESDKGSVYSGLEEDMEKAKDIKELAQVMNKGEY